MSSLKIPHYSALLDFENHIKRTAKELKKSSNLKFMHVREQVVKSLGFENNYDYDSHLKKTKNFIEKLQVDGRRIKSAEAFKNISDTESYMCFFIETTYKLSMTDAPEDYHFLVPMSGKMLAPIPATSIWSSTPVLDVQLSQTHEYRKPVPVNRRFKSNHLLVEAFKKEKIIGYLIDDHDLFFQWIMAWKGFAFIPTSFFHELIKTQHKNPVIAEMNEPFLMKSNYNDYLDVIMARYAFL